ncbi:MAG: GNAT family N-acetyltransferase [Nitrospirae bacterium]|nr:GNAT family N-acetyltransferase [Nitrospirota bacterium]MCL5237687.1 GNAT family N-acetyltransferase [Nitrospirota bacterium]
MSDYRITVIDSPGEWEKLSGPWKDLLEKSSSATIFLTWKWLSSWAECYLNERRKLFILAVYCKDELIGIAPWCIHHIPLKFFTFKQIEFLGGPEAGSDYLDIIIKRGKEKEVTLCIYDFLMNGVPARWDRLMLRDIPSDSLFLLHFLTHIEDEGKYVEIRKESFCPIVSLKEKHDSFLSQISSHRRQRFSRDLKILNRNGEIEHRYLPLKKDIGTTLAGFFSFYKEKKELPDDKLYLLLEKFLSRCGDEEAVEIDLLKSQEKTLAGLLHLRYRDTLSLYLMATDKSFNNKVSIGNILVGLCIERAKSLGLSTYDFLKGSEHYKFHWANGGRSSISISFPQKKIIPILFVIKKFLKNTAKIILR